MMIALGIVYGIVSYALGYFTYSTIWRNERDAITAVMLGAVVAFFWPFLLALALPFVLMYGLFRLTGWIINRLRYLLGA